MSHTNPHSRCAAAWCLLALALACCAAAAAPGPSTCEPQSFVVAVDVGHTHKAPGAISARGVPELEFNLALAAEVQQTLVAGGFSNSFLINADGKIGSLAARPARAASHGADLFLSIHHDSVQPRYLETWTFDGTTRRYSDRFRGYSLFVSGKNPQLAISRRAATLIGEAFRARGLRPSLHHAEPIRGENRPLLDDTLGLYRFDDLVVLKRATMPAVLIEAGIIVNRDEERLLAGPARRQLIAAGVLAGVRALCTELAGDGRSARLGTHATEAAAATPARLRPPTTWPAHSGRCSGRCRFLRRDHRYSLGSGMP